MIISTTKKRKAGEMLGRDGIAQRIIVLANDIAGGSYKNAMEKAGQIAELVSAARYDEYWTEKVNRGKFEEACLLSELLGGEIDKDRMARFVNPRSVGAT
jgi:hypothetical protein